MNASGAPSRDSRDSVEQDEEHTGRPRVGVSIKQEAAPTQVSNQEKFPADGVPYSTTQDKLSEHRKSSSLAINMKPTKAAASGKVSASIQALNCPNGALSKKGCPSSTVTEAKASEEKKTHNHMESSPPATRRISRKTSQVQVNPAVDKQPADSGTLSSSSENNYPTSLSEEIPNMKSISHCGVEDSPNTKRALVQPPGTHENPSLWTKESSPSNQLLPPWPKKTAVVNSENDPSSEQIRTLPTTSKDSTLDNIRSLYRHYVSPYETPEEQAAAKRSKRKLPGKTKSPSQEIKDSSVKKRKIDKPLKNNQGSSEPAKDATSKTRHSKYPERKRTPRKPYQFLGVPAKSRRNGSKLQNKLPKMMRSSYGGAQTGRYSHAASWPAPRTMSKYGPREDLSPPADEEDGSELEESSDEQIEAALELDIQNLGAALQWNYHYEQSLRSDLTYSEKKDLCDRVPKLSYIPMREVLSIVANSLNRPGLLNEHVINMPLDDLDNRTLRRILHFLNDQYGYYQFRDLSNIEYRISFHFERLELRRAENDAPDVPHTNVMEDMNRQARRDPRLELQHHRRKEQMKVKKKKKEDQRPKKRVRKDIDSSTSGESQPPLKIQKQEAADSVRYLLRSKGFLPSDHGTMPGNEDSEVTKTASETEVRFQKVVDELPSVPRKPKDKSQETASEAEDTDSEDIDSGRTETTSDGHDTKRLKDGTEIHKDLFGEPDIDDCSQALQALKGSHGLKQEAGIIKSPGYHFQDRELSKKNGGKEPQIKDEPTAKTRPAKMDAERAIFRDKIGSSNDRKAEWIRQSVVPSEDSEHERNQKLIMAGKDNRDSAPFVSSESPTKNQEAASTVSGSSGFEQTARTPGYRNDGAALMTPQVLSDLAAVTPKTLLMFLADFSARAIATRPILHGELNQITYNAALLKAIEYLMTLRTKRINRCHVCAREKMAAISKGSSRFQLPVDLSVNCIVLQGQVRRELAAFSEQKSMDDKIQVSLDVLKWATCFNSEPQECTHKS